MSDFSQNMRAYSRVLVRSPLPFPQLGFSLIELLVSLFVFSVGLLGLASIQITSMRMALDAQQHYVASLLANAASNQLSVGKVDDTDFWKQQVTASLPSGLAYIDPSPQGYKVTVQWNSSADQTERKSEYVLDVVL